MIRIMNRHHYDGYIRENPRSPAKCDPLLYQDSYESYFTGTFQCQDEVEGFTNLIQKNDLKTDNYQYLNEVSCDNGLATVRYGDEKKQFDITPIGLIKKKASGDILEVNRIHNKHLQNEMGYGNMKLGTLHQKMKNLHYQTNNKVLQAYQKSYLQEPFFQNMEL